MDLSLVVPVFNRPDEIDELLESLSKQSDHDFEIIIIEDGSTVPCRDVVNKYTNKLRVKYFFKPNSGPGLSRNYGMERAEGDYLIVLDSDCIIPEKYIEVVKKRLKENYTDAFGGPDKADNSFTNIQKAINYAMTSFITTGGIRGSKKSMEKFHPRSFNMGYSKDVFNATNGFSDMRYGEDIDMSIRIFELGFKSQLIEDAYVYHKRRTDLKKFFKQVYNSGTARIVLYKKYPKSLKLVHFLPSTFLIGTIFLIVCSFFCIYALLPLALFVLIVFIDSLVKNRSISVALLSIPASFIQLFGYGSGFIASVYNILILGKEKYSAFSKTFYK